MTTKISDAFWWPWFDAWREDYNSIQNSDWLLPARHSQPDSKLRMGMLSTLGINVDRIGGGASPEGFAAFIWTEGYAELQDLSAGNGPSPYPVEDWTEEDCFLRAYEAILDIDIPRWDWDTANFPLLNHPFLDGPDKFLAMIDVNTRISEIEQGRMFS